VRNWREGLRDQWAVNGIYSHHDGFPYITMHYGYHMGEPVNPFCNLTFY
jgi:hypothetical protein